MKKFSMNSLQERIKIHYIFLLIAIPFGLYWSVLLPPFQAPDEYVHFYRAYEISEGHFISNHINGHTGNYIPSSINEFIAKSEISKIHFHPDIKVNQEKLNEAKKIYLSKEKTFIAFPSSAIYSPIPYLPQAIGIYITRMLNLPIYYILLFSRWCNFLFYVTLSFLAIKLIPKLKVFLLLLALMPMTLHQACSLSADASTFGFAFLLSAYIFRLIFSLDIKSIKKKDILVLTILSVGLTLCKSAYFLSFLLIFLIPSKKYPSKIKYWFYNILISFSNALFLFFWMKLCKTNEMVANPVSQVKLILLHPLRFTKQLFGTFIYDDKIFLEFFGIFGWVDTPIPYLIGYLLLALFTLAVSSEARFENENKGTYIKGLLIFIFFIIQTAIVETMLFLAWAPQNDPKIVLGLQGRYFIPIFLILGFSIYLLLPILKNSKIFYVFFVVFSLAISSFFMINRFY